MKRGAANPDSSLTRSAREKRNRQFQLLLWRAFQQIGQPVDLRQSAARLGNGIRGRHEVGEEASGQSAVSSLNTKLQHVTAPSALASSLMSTHRTSRPRCSSISRVLVKAWG